jgi:hypothetical protein
VQNYGALIVKDEMTSEIFIYQSFLNGYSKFLAANLDLLVFL